MRVRAGDNRREVTLPIEKVAESVAVGRDPATAASDPKSERFSNVLSKDQIEALPDDPDEMEKVLKRHGRPGGDHPRGRIPRRQAAAEGADPIDPLLERDVRRRESQRRAHVRRHLYAAGARARCAAAWTSRSETSPSTRATRFSPSKGPEQTQQYNLNLSGTLRKDRTSFSLSAGGASLYDSAYVYAAVPGRPVSGAIRRPSDRLNFNLRVDHALNKAHTLRGSFQQNDNDLQNLGVGNYNLPDRAFDRTSADGVLRLSESGPMVPAVVRGVAAPDPPRRPPTASRASRRRRSASWTPSPSGGAQQAGGRAQHRARVRDRRRLCEEGARAADGHARRGRPLPQRHPHQLPRHLHVPEPGGLQRRPARELHAPRRESAGRIFAVAGGVLRAGRLARAQEPHDQPRGSARSSRPISRITGTWRRAAGSPGRRSRTARRRSAPAAASSTSGSTPTSTSRRCAWTEITSRIW